MPKRQGQAPIQPVIAMLKPVLRWKKPLRPNFFANCASLYLMNNQKQERMLESCDQLHDEDGTDPRHRRGPRRSRDANHRKTQQLCKQVAETIGLVLAGDFDDELLHNLQVVRVTPAPNCSQLLVALRADLEPGTATRNEVTLRLERVAGHLRSEVAMAISRRRVPRLIYQIVAEQDD